MNKIHEQVALSQEGRAFREVTRVFLGVSMLPDEDAWERLPALTTGTGKDN